MPRPETNSSSPILATGFSALHPDIIETHVITRLDGPSLASVASCSTTLRHLSSAGNRWSNICHTTWPSTISPRVSQVITEFPNGGPRAFFSHGFPPPAPASNLNRSTHPSELISAVDIFYKDKLIFSKVQETETSSDWFLCSPFRIDLLEPKDVVSTPITHPEEDNKCKDIIEDMRLSWILMDPIRRRAVNLSSHKPVVVERHWLTGEVQGHFVSILPARDGHVQCEIVVTCGESEESGEMQVREVRVEMENMDGLHLNGKESIVIFEEAMEGKKGSGRNRVEESRRRYTEYMEMKKERREKKLRTEGTLDNLCVAFGVSIFIAFWFFILAR